MIEARKRGHSPLRLLTAFLAIFTLGMSTAAHATKIKKQNLTELIGQSESIVAGTVKSVTDGFDANGVPYTEITIAVGSVAKGQQAEKEDYTFRQFGLLEPRSMGNGKIYLGTTPQGFAKWNADEFVIAFLYKPASRTGLQTTVGLAQGKFTAQNGMIANEFGNAGLFTGVNINPALLDAEQASLLRTTGEVPLDDFMKLVGDAVDGNWIESGDMK